MNIAGFPAPILGNLVIQIQNLVANPGFPLNTTERSPLFQIAAYLEVPPMPHATIPNVEITNKTFAAIRQEALKTPGINGRKKNSVKRASCSDQNRQVQSA
jgi:hypothetical protein